MNAADVFDVGHHQPKHSPSVKQRKNRNFLLSLWPSVPARAAFLCCFTWDPFFFPVAALFLRFLATLKVEKNNKWPKTTNEVAPLHD